MTLNSNIEEMYATCISGLSDFVKEAGFLDVVIGLSGGIDSSLVATMAVDALGADHVHGVLLPGPFSSESSLKDAFELADNLQIDSVEIGIGGAYEAFEHGFLSAMNEPLSGLASENTQARCRMVYLMAISNAKGWLMLNTGNRSEAAMGYSTLYGDTAGAVAPIGGAYKTEVFAMAKWRNEKALSEGLPAPIPDQILTKPPSAELSEAQTDEASMGISYAELDEILYALLDEGKAREEVASAGHEAGLVDMVADRYASYAFKRDVEPPIIEIGRR